MTRRKKNYFWQLGLASYLTISGAIVCALEKSVFAQTAITPDNTLGNNISNTITVGNNVFIVGGVVKNTNVFHSFREFNIGEGRGAFFFTDSGIQNIIARVTGTNVSKILGTLGAFEPNSISNANVFLINPNGIIIGRNAFITVGGSFVGSTANGIKFADGAVFSASDKQTNPMLTISTPIGLQFGRNPGNILVQNSLITVSPGRTLALVGGNVTVDNVDNLFSTGRSLLAQNGQIAIGGISEAGTVGLNLDSSSLPLSFPSNVALADISFINGALLDADGNGGGHIQLQGRNITLTGGSLLSADTTGNQRGRGISIQGQLLTVKGGSQIRTSTRSMGAGGDLTLRVSDTVQVSGTDAVGNPSALLAETFAQGAAGNLSIETSKLIVEDGGNIAAAAREGSRNNGGTLTINASDFVRLSGTSLVQANRSSGLFALSEGTGDAGSLTIETRQLIVQNGAQITAGTLEGSSGNGGTLTVRATDFIELNGTGVNSQIPSGLFARSLGSGDAGALNISTGRLTVQDNARITVESLGSGNAGNLDIQARLVRLDGQGQITAETASGQGGNISLRNLALLLLRGNSQITTSADTSRVGADVAGGNINIDSALIVATPGANSDITANAFRGQGGNINIITNGLFGIEPRDRQTPQNDITASSQLGINGTIQINTPDVDPNSSIVTFPTEIFDASQAIAQGCGSDHGKGYSSIIITGRGGLPPTPDEPLNSNVLWSDTRLTSVTAQPSNAQTAMARSDRQAIAKLSSAPNSGKIVPATGWVLNNQGDVTLTAHVPNLASYGWETNHTSCHANK